MNNGIKGDNWGSVSIIWDQWHCQGGYDWGITAIVRNAEGLYALHTDGGCSCHTAYEDSPESEDLAWNDNLRTVVNEAKSVIRQGYGLDVGEKAEALAKLSRLYYRETRNG